MTNKRPRTATRSARRKRHTRHRNRHAVTMCVTMMLTFISMTGAAYTIYAKQKSLPTISNSDLVQNDAQPATLEYGASSTSVLGLPDNLIDQLNQQPADLNYESDLQSFDVAAF